MASEPRPAATVVVLRDGPVGPEIFMVERSGKSAFMPHAHVFPGGRVDPEDGAVEVAGGAAEPVRMGLSRSEAVAYQVCAVRETYEEANILLAEGAPDPEVRRSLQERRETFHAVSTRLGWSVDGASVVYWGWWITPRQEARRFDTRFFVAGVSAARSAAAIHDEHETVHSAWWTAEQALARFDAGEIFLAPPTYVTLLQLRGLPTVQAVLEAGRRRQVVSVEPAVTVTEDGSLAIVLPGDPDHPVREPVEGVPRRLVMREGRWWIRR